MTNDRLGPASLRRMDDAQIAEIPAHDLALMLDDLEQWEAQLDELKTIVVGAALKRLAADEAAARPEDQPFGDVTFSVEGTDRTFTIMRLRKVEWNTRTLKRLAPLIEENRGGVIARKLTLSITEAKLKALPPEKRALAEHAMTLIPGKVRVRANPPKED